MANRCRGIDLGIVYEFLRVVTHPKALDKPLSPAQALQFLDALAVGSMAMLLPTDRHAEILRDLLRELPHARGNIMHDAHTVVLMREHGISRVYTRDVDFHRFPGIDVIDPARA